MSATALIGGGTSPRAANDLPARHESRDGEES
jgi:hypothetical protein